MPADSITSFGFESIPVRGSLVHLRRTWRRMLRDHDYDALVMETLGHSAAATALIAQSLKFEGAITLQIQRGDVLKMLVMQSTNELELRGMAIVDSAQSADNFDGLTRNAVCAVTVDNGDRPYQGIVEVGGGSLAASLEHYFARSVQVPSHLALVADEQVSAGILLQQIPGEAIDEDDWRRLHYLVATLSTRDFTDAAGIDLVGKLFAEDDVRVYQPRPVTFRCGCSARKTEDVLKMIGEDEARETLAEQGQLEVVCEFCGRRRTYDAVDVERLFADNVVTGPDSVQ
ncbi:MAG: Hsp33 family molecular chaperone HslO [Gammaproteobacteria bacterium]|nr:Hsp33 family molecular chaperone HslO [Gammaproteobacteria bacterium]